MKKKTASFLSSLFARARGFSPPTMSRSLEKDLRELERLLKADQASNGGAGGGGGGTSTIKQQLRSVLRKLMEAYFNPLNGERERARERELSVIPAPRHLPATAASRARSSRTHSPISPARAHHSWRPLKRSQMNARHVVCVVDLTTPLGPLLFFPSLASSAQFTRGR